MGNDDLKVKAASGMAWTAIQKYMVMGVQFVSGIILARLLTPYDYGCIGMLAIFTTIASSFIDGGFGSALIQKKKPTQSDYSTIFFWNLGVALLMFAILFLCAPAIAKFYNIPLLSSILRVQSITLVIGAFNIIQSNQLRKQLQFKVISIVTTITSIVSVVITIVMAYMGYGVWSLVISNIISSIIPTTVYWIYSKWRPKFIFSWKSFKELFSFGFYMFLTHLINNISSQIQGLLIGKVYNPSTMGYYSKAHSTELLASKSISDIMNQVTYPLYAEIQDEKDRLIAVIRRITLTLSYATFPILFLLLLLAKPIFVLLYSERWLLSVPYFQILCIAGLAVCLQGVNLQAIAAVGKSKNMLVGTIVKRIVGLTFIIGGLSLFGMPGLLWGMVLNSWFAYFVNAWLVSKHVGYKLDRQLLDILPMMLLSGGCAVVCYLMGRFLGLSMYPTAAIQLILYVALYLGCSILFKLDSYQYCKGLLPMFFGKFKRKK